MRSSSSARRRFAAWLLLAVSGAWCPGRPVAAATPAGEPEPAVLLRYAESSVPEDGARAWSDRLPGLLAAELRVRWVKPAADETTGAGDGLFPVADGKALAEISALVSEARRRAGRMETKEAERGLLDGEKKTREYRLSDTTRPLLAEIFLWRGALFLWNGRQAEAEAMFARSLALRPEFTPDPALFSPQFREAWTRGGTRIPSGADLVVSSLPAGAEIRVDGIVRGKTPDRVRIPGDAPVTIRLGRPGYRSVSRTGQWLPGDREVLDVVLPPDRTAAIGEILRGSPDGASATGALSELAEGCGAARAAVVILGPARGETRIRVLSWKKGDPSITAAGEFATGSGDESDGDAARRIARMLAAAGWPAGSGVPGGGGRPWYHSWWFWGLVGAAVVGVAAGLGSGGGGASGSSAGTIGVIF